MIKMEIKLVNWQYCKNLDEINAAIVSNDPEWSGLTSSKDIISITYDTNQECYLVIWRVGYET